MERHVVLYDADCGFCEWSLAKLLAWDRRRRLRPLPLQAPEAGSLLADMDDEHRMASWHLVSPDGSRRSGGDAFAPLARLLPGGALLAGLAAAAPAVSRRAYDWVARNRGVFGMLVPAGAVRRAPRRIERHS